MAAGHSPQGILAPFTVQIPSWQIVAVALACVSAFVHICVLKRASYSLRTLIGLAGLSLFLSSTTASELAAQDDSSVQQLLWCLCTSILTDNYDPNTDAQAWKRVLWMLSTWLQLGLMYRRTSVASSTAQQILFRAVVVLKGMKLHFLHGWHCSSWDETKDDSKTQCEHLAAVATWSEKEWSPFLERVEAASVMNGTILDLDNVFFWRSILEGKPRRAIPGGFTIGRDCCEIAVRFKRTPSAVIPAVAFSIKRQFKAKLGSMATLSAHYSYLATSEMALAFSIIALMACEWREEKRTLPARFCLLVWCLELVYHVVTCRRAFRLSEEIYQQSSEMCRLRKSGLRPVKQTCLVITDLILGSIAEAVVTGLASIGKGATVWAKLSNFKMMKQWVETVRWTIAMCIVMPMAILASGGKYLFDLSNGVCKKRSRSGHFDEQLLDCITNLQRLQDLLKRHPDEMSVVERIMYPSISDTTASSLEAPSEPTSAPVTCYSLTALEAVLFSQLLGQAATLVLAGEIDEPQSFLNVWKWTSKAFKDGMVDSSWLSPNISRAMWHAATLEQSEVWQTALSDVRQVLVGDINPSVPESLSLEDVSKAAGAGMASLEGARRAVLHLIANLDSEPGRPSLKVELAMRAGLFAVVVFCQTWGGPETVGVPGPLEHECLMACFVAPAFKDTSTTISA